MTIQKRKKVYAVNGMLQAVTVQDALERAGIPAEIQDDHNEGYLSILVPEEWVYDAHNLLYPERSYGEMALVPVR